MDPVSTLLAAYLNSIEDPAAERWQQGNTQPEKSLSLEFEGYDVHYNYSLWQIERSSLCNRYQLTNINSYSSCTNKAIALFAQTCDYLNSGKVNSLYTKQLKNMYCSAARDFKPSVATIRRAGNDNDLASARRECNAATLKARGSSDAYLVRKREVLCESYQLLKADN